MIEYGYINENGYLVSRIIEEEQIAELAQKGWKQVDLVDESRLECDDEFSSVKIEPYDAGDRIKYRYPVVANTALVSKKMTELKNDLSETDYQVLNPHCSGQVGYCIKKVKNRYGQL